MSQHSIGSGGTVDEIDVHVEGGVGKQRRRQREASRAGPDDCDVNRSGPHHFP
jgi:hypothetical protein